MTNGYNGDTERIARGAAEWNRRMNPCPPPGEASVHLSQDELVLLISTVQRSDWRAPVKRALLNKLVAAHQAGGES